MILAFLFACGADGDSGPVDVGDPAPVLEVPDLTDLDLEAAYPAALTLALQGTVSPVWAGHVASMDLARAGCPDLYAGPPADEDAEVDEEEGVSWYDHCTTDGGLFFSGWAWWDAAIEVADEVDGQPGQAVQASRTLVADGVIGDDVSDLYAFDGEAEDALTQETADGYDAWTWSSVVTGSVGGSLVMDGTDTPDGWRADLSLYATGPAPQTLTLVGNLYAYNPVLQERFDSVSVDLTWTDTASSDACALEPVGYLSVRDEDAFWYDLVFQPLEDESMSDSGYADDPYAACDGCGTLYVRGIEQGTVCPDLSFLWAGAITPPTVDDFVLSLHDLEGP